MATTFLIWQAFFRAGKLAFVDDLVSGHKKLSNDFFKKMTHNLATWRLRRAVSAVRCALIIS